MDYAGEAMSSPAQPFLLLLHPLILTLYRLALHAGLEWNHGGRAEQGLWDELLPERYQPEGAYLPTSTSQEDGCGLYAHQPQSWVPNANNLDSRE